MKVTGPKIHGGDFTPTGQRWAALGVHSWIRILVVALLLAWVFHLELRRLVVRWFTDPSWSHGLLIPLFSLYFLHQRKDEILSLKPQPYVGGLVLLIACLVFYFLNLISPAGYAYFRSLSLVVAIFAVVWFWAGNRILSLTWLPIAYLFFAVPLPRRLYVSLTMPMRAWAATVAAALLDAVPQVETSVRGVVIDVLVNGQPIEPALNVAEACSGMRLLMAFVALGVALAYLQVRPWPQRLVLLVSSVPIAVLCNIVRVTVTGFLYALVDRRYTQGIYHDLLGLAMLPLALGCYGFIGWFMSSLWVDERSQGRDVVTRSSEGGASS